MRGVSFAMSNPDISPQVYLLVVILHYATSRSLLQIRSRTNSKQVVTKSMSPECSSKGGIAPSSSGLLHGRHWPCPTKPWYPTLSPHTLPPSMPTLPLKTSGYGQNSPFLFQFFAEACQRHRQNSSGYGQNSSLLGQTFTVDGIRKK